MGKDSDLGTECYGMIERGAAPTYRFHYSSAPYDVESPMHSDAYVNPGSWINILHEDAGIILSARVQVQRPSPFDALADEAIIICIRYKRLAGYHPRRAPYL